MTNKKLKMAAMSVALTACVAASPLAANADAPEAAPEKTEPVAEETKKEENTAEPQVNQEAKNAQETLKDAEVKYDKENPTTNPDGSQKLDGVIVTNPEGSGETGSGETGSGETGSGESFPQTCRMSSKHRSPRFRALPSFLKTDLCLRIRRIITSEKFLPRQRECQQSSATFLKYPRLKTKRQPRK